MAVDQSRIRNLCIIAHVDHGKSTLADRMIQKSGLVSVREFHDQMLDTMDIERERGITIKSNTVVLPYRGADGQEYEINLIDTPGHADFSYEVSRVIASCEGALLLVDATQGVQAQTVANLYKALNYDLSLVPVVNKVDLASADIDGTLEQIDQELGLPAEDSVMVSAKTGQGVDELMEAIVRMIPAPKGDPNAPLRALIFDAEYSSFRGVICQFRVMEGTLRKGDAIRFFSTGAEYRVEEIGRLQIRPVPCDELRAGEVGYMVAGIKKLADVRIGDTLTLSENPAKEALPGFEPVKPMVFSSLYPMASDDYEDFAAAIQKYALNDSALVFQKDTSAVLGFGFRCGFLGLLHLEIVQERLQREYGLSLVLTAPSVIYRVRLKDGTSMEVDNPSYFPDPSQIETVEEPYVKVSIMTPEKSVGAVLNLCVEARGVAIKTDYLAKNRLEVKMEAPLSEIIYHFYERLKTVTQGYGSLDYEFMDYRKSDVVKIDILVNGERLDALSQLVHQSKAREYALYACTRLEESLPRQNFKIAIQGAIGGTIIARKTLSAFRKDVTAKCYGGDITRKRKLLEKQKAGKARMKMVGQVSVPQEAFVAVLRAPTE